MSVIDQKSAEAYQAWELCEYESAHNLFLETAELEKEASSKRTKWAAPDSSILYELRAGFCLWQDGQADRSMELLISAKGFDWKEARLWNGRHSSDTAYTYMLLYEKKIGTLNSFEKLFFEANKNGVQIKQPFSSITPNQISLLNACLDLESKTSLSILTKNIDEIGREKTPELESVYNLARKFKRKKWFGLF